MAVNTSKALRNQIIYSVYVRNHTEEGTFLSIIPDLDRIKALGTDIIWFMPIHPIGAKGKKGSLGCPYANKDYRTTNPDYGTMEDFQTLVDAIHARGMKCMIDVVYNHTSPDATLVTEHPEFYYRKPDGSFGNKTADWTDVIDLDYDNPGLWDYQIESLKLWAGIVDGFRCDVASLVPVEFWRKAREAVAEVNPDCLWLAETIHSTHNLFARVAGQKAYSDYEMFSAFDMEYEYDIRIPFEQYLEGKIALSHYIDMLNLQEAIYPDNYNKMRCLENHDMPRICSYVTDEQTLRNYTAMLFFLQGSTLLYAGQEYENTHLPSLFEKDVFSRNTGKDLSSYLQKLAEVKKTRLNPEDYFFGAADDQLDIAILQRLGKKKTVGLFSLKGKTGRVSVDLPDGVYENFIDGKAVTVENGSVLMNGEPVIMQEN